LGFAEDCVVIGPGQSLRTHDVRLYVLNSPGTELPDAPDKDPVPFRDPQLTVAAASVSAPAKDMTGVLWRVIQT
jgi:hypothetical protein